jgi:hypothetical protein
MSLGFVGHHHDLHRLSVYRVRKETRIFKGRVARWVLTRNLSSAQTGPEIVVDRLSCAGVVHVMLPFLLDVLEFLFKDSVAMFQFPIRWKPETFKFYRLPDCMETTA